MLHVFIDQTSNSSKIITNHTVKFLIFNGMTYSFVGVPAPSHLGVLTVLSAE